LFDKDPMSPFTIRSSHLRTVQIAQQAPGGRAEAFIEDVRRSGERVEVDVLLADGSDATAQLSVQDWDWLELRTGDIVFVDRAGSAAISA
jgi:hypothetical protein